MFACLLVYLVMELMYESLDNLVQDKKREFSWQQRQLVLHDVAAGLAMLHEAEVLHRDLKPANVLVSMVVFLFAMLILRIA